MADIECMFHSFLVKEEHQDYLCFLWFQDHNLDGVISGIPHEGPHFWQQPLPIGSCVWAQENSCSVFRTSEPLCSEEEYGSNVRLFIERHFYVAEIIQFRS